jgi:hypothetical protein
LHAVLMRGMHYVSLDHQIRINEICRVCAVGMNAANSGGGEVYLIGSFRRKKRIHCGLVGQIKLGMRRGQNILGAARG